ncbi:hypothetical protein HPP92_008190 [Vanilla planifolia]|uniref:RNA polymerase sigma-70 domain-containing protein n=1 Tax=Vanilla planifolia TaxID=51239 RepID=A0A835R5U4_VANPL|nr:hypothetical protein HPP92_008190 [Vanilla planifolia]
MTDELNLPQNLIVRSKRQIERRARRAGVAEAAIVRVSSGKLGSSGRKRRATLRAVDFSDPLHYLRDMSRTSKLLTATEEQQLSEGIQELLKLERKKEELAERIGRQPTTAQWATFAGLNTKTLMQRLNYGIDCRDKMIKSNIRLVISIAKKFHGAGMSIQDLVQLGIVEACYRIREARNQLYLKNRTQPDDREIAEAAGLTMKRFETVMLAPKAPISMDQRSSNYESSKLSEVTGDPEASTPEDILVRQSMKDELNRVLDYLNPREKQVIKWRFGLEGGRLKTQQEIGEMMGVSRERIRQIESCAIRKLKKKKRTKDLGKYLCFC